VKIIITESQFKKVKNIIFENDEQKLNVMFVGDSHSAGKGYTWNYLLEKDHPNWKVTHVVKGGMRTDWMLTNMSAELKKKKYDLVFIYGGTNDVMSPLKIDTPISNIQKMVDLVNEQGGKAIVVLGFDQEGMYDYTKVKPTRYCDRECFKNFGPKRVEYQQKLGQSISNAKIIPKLEADKSWSTDGIHATASKHGNMKDHVEKYLDESQPKVEKQQQTTGKNEIVQKFFKRYINFLGEGRQVTKDSTQKDIKMLQIVFKLVEKPDININGVLDEKTKMALLNYQKEKKLQRTGYFDLETIESLTRKLLPQLSISSLKKSQTNNIDVVGEKVSQDKLLKDLISKGLKENTAKGLVANAYGESGFNIKAKGDSGSIAAKSSKAIPIGDKRYCSFGLWQYNVCGGAGINFLKKNGSNPDSSNIEEKLKILFDYEKQLDFMIQTIKPEDNKGDKDVLTWVNWIVDNIERPSDRSGAKRKRGDFAKNQGWA
jgi:lysophospholipase L1-like esterase